MNPAREQEAQPNGTAKTRLTTLVGVFTRMATIDIYMVLFAVLFTALLLWLYARFFPRRQRYYPVLAVRLLAIGGGVAVNKMFINPIETGWLRWGLFALLIVAIAAALSWLESQMHKLRRREKHDHAA